MALSNASGPSSRPPCDLPALGHLAERRGVERGGHLRVHGLDRGEDRHLRPLHAERPRQVDRVLADVHLVLERRRDVDRAVGDDQHLVVGRHVHEEHVAHAPAGAEAGLAWRRPRPAVRPCAGCPSSAARPRPCGPAPPPSPPTAWLSGDVDDSHAAEVDAVRLRRSRGSSRPGRRGSGTIRPFVRRRRWRPSSAVSSQGYATAVGMGARPRQRSSSCSYLPVPVLDVMTGVHRKKRWARRTWRPPLYVIVRLAEHQRDGQAALGRLLVLRVHLLRGERHGDTVVSKSTRRLAGISLLAIMKPVHALTAPNAQRSMHGTCT